MVTKPIHVLFFTTHLGGGGAEKHLVRVANCLDRSRFRVSVAASRGGGSYEADLRHDIAYYPLGARKTWRAVPALRRLIRRVKPDVVCPVLDEANLAAVLATRFSAASEIPLVLGLQNPPSIQYRLGAGLRSRAMLWAIRRLYPRSSHLVALAEGVKEDIVGLLPKVRARVSVIYNAGYDDQLLRMAAASLPREAEYEADTPVLVACGRLVEQKGFVYLLQAVARVRESRPVRLWLVGEGELRHELEREAIRLGIEDAVVFAGFQPNPYRFMRAADLFVLSSLFEGFGNVVVEAMASGSPVVATDCPFGPPEIIEDGVSGRLVPVADPEAMARVIVHLLDHPEERAALARNGQVRARDFHARVIAGQYEALLAEIAVDAADPCAEKTPSAAAAGGGSR